MPAMKPRRAPRPAGPGAAARPPAGPAAPPARPPRPALARRLPDPVAAPQEGAPHAAAALDAGRAPCQLTGDGRRLDTPARDLADPRGPERAPRDQEAEGLQEVGLALGGGADEDVQPRLRVKLQGAIAAYFRQLHPGDPHPAKLLFLLPKYAPRYA